MTANPDVFVKSEGFAVARNGKRKRFSLIGPTRDFSKSWSDNLHRVSIPTPLYPRRSPSQFAVTGRWVCSGFRSLPGAVELPRFVGSRRCFAREAAYYQHLTAIGSRPEARRDAVIGRAV